MFGNVKGWLMSSLIVAATVWLIWARGTPERISPPSGKFTYALQPISVGTDPGTLVPAGTKDCDAGALYRQAAEHVRKNRKKYDAFGQAKGADKLTAAAALDEGLAPLLEARDCAKMTLFVKKPSEVVNYDNEKPVLPELQRLQQVVVTLGAIHYPKDPEKAKRHMEAAFVMGRHLYNERLTFEEYRIGTEAMANAAGMMAKFSPYAKDDAKKDQLLKFVGEVEAYQKDKVIPLWQAISGIETARGGKLKFAGDMFQIAQSDKADPMWRAEAMLKLGRMRYMQETTYGDQAGAGRVLNQLTERTDLPPGVKEAAKAGRDLPVEKFRMYGGGA